MEPEQGVLKQEALAQLLSAIGKLPALQQEVLRLRFGHGLSCGEMAPDSNPASRVTVLNVEPGA